MNPGLTSTSKVLAVLEACNWPSSVVRALIYKDLFARDRFEVEFIGRRPHRARLAAITGGTKINELRILAKAGAADVIYLSKVTSVGFVRRLRRRSRARIVLDFGDAVWLDSKDQRRDAEFAELLRIVDAVTTDNEFTAAYVRSFGKPCTVIPDSPQLEAFDRRRESVRPRTDGSVIVGWIGTASTLYNLELIANALHAVSRKHPEMRMHLLAWGLASTRNGLRLLDGIPHTVLPSYDQARMIDEVFDMDIGLFPLQDTERSIVRGVLKAGVYMCGEAAVIASPIGQVAEVIQDGVNGMLASTNEEWMIKLDSLVSDAALRRRLAAAGLETVRERFRTHQSWELLRAVLRGVAA